jgi:hypothetical protein
MVRPVKRTLNVTSGGTGLPSDGKTKTEVFVSKVSYLKVPKVNEK